MEIKIFTIFSVCKFLCGFEMFVSLFNGSYSSARRNAKIVVSVK
jgi:hypothetical protein